MTMRIILLLALVPVLGLGAGFLASSPAEETAHPFYLGGIQINEPDHELWVRALHQAGMNTVSVTVYGHQGDWDSDNFWFETAEPGVVSEIRTAKAHGLRVVLVLRVALDHAFPRNAFLWHGLIMPQSDAQLRSWFQKYETFVRTWAEIADREAVDVFVIGSELKCLTATTAVDTVPDLQAYYADSTKLEAEKAAYLALSHRLDRRHFWARGRDNYADPESYFNAKNEAHLRWARQVSYADASDRLQRINQRRRTLRKSWQRVIQLARQTYGGPLAYAANFDNYREVAFWSALDFIGINAYFPLSPYEDGARNPTQALARMQAAWDTVLTHIDGFRNQRGLQRRPVLFTEIGYTYRRYATVHPWNGSGFALVGPDSARQLVVWDEQPVDFSERVLAMRALRRALRRHPKLLAGLLYWKLSTAKSHEAIEPFMLYVGPGSHDELLQELRRFVN